MSSSVAAAKSRGRPPQTTQKRANAKTRSVSPLMLPDPKKARQLSPPKEKKPDALVQKFSSNPNIARLERAEAALRPKAMEGYLPCRDVERRNIMSHLRTAVNAGGSCQILYISGMPGTGKTLSVLDAIKRMRADKKMKPFTFAHTNAMRLGTPNAFFGELLSQLPNEENGLPRKRCAATAAHAELVNFFSERRPQDQVVVLLVDEIDHLVTRNQAVLYRIFDMLALPRPKLVVVAISNTMDLPERLLPRVASRINVARVDYEPYRRDQIVEILTGRLKRNDASCAFSETVLKLCAARVAAGTGDVRKALQLCRRAVEVRLAAQEKRGDALVDICHLEAAEKELLHANPAAQGIRGLSGKTRLLLTALTLELRKKGVDAISLSKVVSRYGKLRVACQQATALASLVTNCPEAADEAEQMLHRLEAMALVIVQRVTQRHAPGRPSVGEKMLSLGAGLETEDLASILETVEEDEGLKDLLRCSERDRSS